MKYLKNHQHLAIQLCATEPGRSVFQRWGDVAFEGGDRARDAPFGKTHLVEVVTDADWASQVFTQRRSISSFCVFVDGNLCHCGNRVQKSTSLSSAESELCGSLLGVHEAVLVCRMVQFLCGAGCEVKLVHYVDNSATRAVIQREGLGKMKHIDLAWLWIQRAHKEKLFGFMTKPISTAVCPADLATKSHPRRRSKLLCGLIGMYDCEHEEVFGAQEVVQQNFGSQKVLSKAQLFRVCVMLAQIKGALGSPVNGGDSYYLNFFNCYMDFILMTIIVAMAMLIMVGILYFFSYKIFELNNNTKTVIITIHQGASTASSSFTSASSSSLASNSTSTSSAGASSSRARKKPVQAPALPVAQSLVHPEVYTIGQGKCFHRRECAMVQRAMRLERHKVKGPISHHEAQRLSFRSCRQCNPLSGLK